MKIIRSDKLSVKVQQPEQREALDATLLVYRNLVRDLMTVMMTHWPALGRFDGNAVVKEIEQLIHPTSKRPEVRYPYFARRYYKFPSYLRRVAIMDAAGQVRSFNTRFERWRAGDRKKATVKPPQLVCATNTYPALYRGQCIRFNSDHSRAEIKVVHRGDWVWMAFGLAGDKRHIKQGRQLSPSLVNKRGRYMLSVPVERRVRLPSNADIDRVLSVDVGINTASTWAVIDASGTVHARGFLGRSDKDREARLIARIQKAARQHTRHGCRLPPGFCARDHRRLRGLFDNAAHQISRRIVGAALAHGAQAIVVEQLKGWRPTAGRRRSGLRQRFHRWFHRLLVERIETKAAEAGLRTLAVYPRGTSSQAFDGSGKVRRDKGNASLCTFPGGKRYSTDLNAAYNIAARGIVSIHRPAREGQAGAGRPKSASTPRSPVTLSSLWPTAMAAA